MLIAQAYLYRALLQAHGNPGGRPALLASWAMPSAERDLFDWKAGSNEPGDDPFQAVERYLTERFSFVTDGRHAITSWVFFDETRQNMGRTPT